MATMIIKKSLKSNRMINKMNEREEKKNANIKMK